jgi:hypothetical protein
MAQKETEKSEPGTLSDAYAALESSWSEFLKTVSDIRQDLERLDARKPL